ASGSPRPQSSSPSRMYPHQTEARRTTIGGRAVLADSAYWLTHDHTTGHVRTSSRSAALIVTAAVVGEFVLDGSLRIRHDRWPTGGCWTGPSGSCCGWPSTRA